MKKFPLFSNLLLSLVAFHIQAQDMSIVKVVLLTTFEESLEKIEDSRDHAITDNFHMFILDESSIVLEHFEKSFPNEFNNYPIHEKENILFQNIVPHLLAYIPEIMKSEMGISLAKLYRIERLPAVIINDRYVTYGLSVQDSVTKYNLFVGRAKNQ
ncbi:DUF1525 domain-containing protein [Vibrio metoecus]|nr:DUF1525 domain-containing protein [Vibrio cholerae]